MHAHSFALITMVGDAAAHLWSNWDDVLTGATAFGIIAHAVQSFPTPKNPYGSWLLGVVQFAVGQRQRAQNTVNGAQTLTFPAYTPPKGDQ